MSRIGSLLSDKTWRYALPAGLVALSLTAFGYWQTGSEISLSPVLLAGVGAGYAAVRATGDRDGVGLRVGLVGGLPILWMVFDGLPAIAGLGGPPWFVAVGSVFAVGAIVTIVVLGFGFSAAVGAIGARFGGWLANKNTRQRRPAAGS